MSAAAPTGPSPTGTSLDAGALARLRELDPEGRLGVVDRVLTAFEKSLDRMVGQLQTHRSGGDADAVANIAHTLRSSSASVGALSLSTACGEIERRLRSGVAGDLDADVERLIREGEAALKAVAAMLRP